MTYDEEAVETYINANLARFEEQLLKKLAPEFAQIEAAHVQVYLHCFAPTFPGRDAQHTAALAAADRYVEDRRHRLWRTRVEPELDSARETFRLTAKLRMEAGHPIQDWPR